VESHGNNIGKETLAVKTNCVNAHHAIFYSMAKTE
jgi:hypothetical protein